MVSRPLGAAAAAVLLCVKCLGVVGMRCVRARVDVDVDVGVGVLSYLLVSFVCADGDVKSA